MISIQSKEGSVVKFIPKGNAEAQVYGFHPKFGFINTATWDQRARARKLKGLSKVGTTPWLCRFTVDTASPHITLDKPENCKIQKISDSLWELSTPAGTYRVGSTQSAVIERALTEEGRSPSSWRETALAMLLLLALLPLLKFRQDVPPAPQVLESVTVKLMPEAQQPTKVPVPAAVLESNMPTKEKQVRRAIAQNLGFLGILGRKDLKGALGGMPTTLGPATPGAGPGGTGGSGGELLVGLGQGVKRTTVGNSGVSGLGGLGTKGAGGGAGGYGNSLVGSGEGRTLSAIPLSQDVVLEGGLDRSVVQATIAKYLSQVRACYEEGLRTSPGLSGQVTMGFEIGGSGRLNYAKVAKSSLAHAGVEGCISRKMLDWQFPKPVGGVNVKVNYPFLLRPVGT